MKNKSLKDILIPALSLFLIGLVCTALLAGTNLLTKDKIAETNQKNANEAKAGAFEAAADFEDATATDADGNEFTYYKALDADKNVLGYVFEMTAKSYGGPLKCMVGISRETDEVVGVKITQIDDTPGLGMKAKTDPSFLEQYVGKIAGIEVQKGGGATGNRIDAITGATISSRAVTDAVNGAFDLYSQVKDGESNG